MTYNSNMKRASLAAGTHNPPLPLWKSGSLASVLAVISILLASFGLWVSVRGVMTSGDYRSLLTHQTLNPFITMAFAIIGALVASRHPRNSNGWIFVAVGILYAMNSLTAAIRVYAPYTSPVYAVAVWFSNWVWILAAILPMTFVLLVFPDGHLASPGWRPVAWAVVLGLATVILAVMVHPSLLSAWDPQAFTPGPRAAPVLYQLVNIGLVLLLIGFVGSFASFFVRFRRSTGIQRGQMKWLAYAVGIMALGLVISFLIGSLWPGNPLLIELTIVLTNLSILGLAVAAAIAILRHRLYDIDLIINRTLVYTTLMVGVAALYGLAVGALGALFQASGNLVVSLATTGLAAILIQPMRDSLQRLVNRMMYGERDEPYAVLSRLSRRLEASLAPDATLPTVVETVAQALKLPYVAIALKQEGDFQIAASYGLAGEEQIQLPLIYQGDTVGQLRLSTRSSEESFTPAERRLLKDIARHIGAATHSVVLTQQLRKLAEDLQRSREELVKSREEERRRLRRDLHDELGPQLASLKLNLDIAHTLVSRDPGAAETLLLDLRSKSQSAIADIRRLVYDLRPPALDELGLVGAIKEYGRQIESKDGLNLQWFESEPLPPLPAAVEVAAYRITMESLTNIVRHSQGLNCQISISMIDDCLQVEVCDDGLGLPENVQPGVGLNSMSERAAELGGNCVIEALPKGGTRVFARLPLQ